MWNHTLLGDDIRPMPSLSDVYRVTKTADGYITSIVVSDAEWQGMCRAIDRTELASAPKYANVVDRLHHLDELIEILDTEIGRWKTDEICARLDAEEVPFAKVNSLDEVHLDPQVAHRGSLVEVDHPSGGRMRMPQPCARFAATPSSIRYLAPTLGQHTDEILSELGRSVSAIAELRAAGAVA
jgi:crotonobetainyl-CoA:carnitine CoA-transferase CaiB-like acyl-CoA transferase